MQALSRQGCHRSALECGKLLLSLDTDDPLGALQLFDYLCLRAGSYELLLEFVARYEGDRSLALLPNYSYSMALAQYRLQQQQQEQGANEASTSASAAAGRAGASTTASTSAVSGSGEGSGNGNGSSSSAEEQMQQALLLHPQVLPLLVAKLRQQGSASDGAWNAVLSRKLFADADKPSAAISASLAHLSNLYAERTHLLWRPPDALQLLLEGAKAAANVADGKATMAGGLGASDWACVREQAFPLEGPSGGGKSGGGGSGSGSGQRNEYSHLRLHDFSDHVSTLPREEMQAAFAAGGAAEVEDLAEAAEQQHLQVCAAGCWRLRPVTAPFHTVICFGATV